MNLKMKKHILNISLVILIATIFLSCDTSFDPKGDFEQAYSLYSVINGDTSLQIATVKSSVDLEGFTARHGESDPSVLGANITIELDGNEYVLSDSSLPSNERYPYDNEVPFYYVDGLQPKAGDSLSIRAVLPNGKILTGLTVVPQNLRFHFTTTRGVITRALSNLYIPEWTINETEVLFAPRLLLNYYIIEEDGSETHHVEEVPQEFVLSDNEAVPVFPNVTKRRQIRYKIDDFISFLTSISEGDSVKSRYYVDKAVLEVLVMNKDFATYFSSINTFDNSFTVQTQPPNYTNISGGNGVFGFYIKPTLRVDIDASIIHDLGYRLYSNR